MLNNNNEVKATLSPGDLATGCYLFEYNHYGQKSVERVRKTVASSFQSLDHLGHQAQMYRKLVDATPFQCDKGRSMKVSMPETEGTRIVTYCGLCDRIIED